jgi:hypothetical protein
MVGAKGMSMMNRDGRLAESMLPRRLLAWRFAALAFSL